MSHRAHRFTDPPTKANRFAWVGCWIRHRRGRTSGPNSRFLAKLMNLGCVRPPSAPDAPTAIPNTPDITPQTPVCPLTLDN